MEADFSGYATKANLKCSDGKTITPKAFSHMDKMQVPLVYNHGHSNAENVLGHAILEVVADGVRAHGYFNNTKQGQNAKEYVRHGDIKNLSIYANKLAMQGQTVVHGQIREVSLVLAGANPGAVIDYVQVKHGDDPHDVETLTDEAVIHTGLEFENVSEDKGELQHADANAVANAGDKSALDVYDTLSDDQKSVVNYMIGAALEEANAAKPAETTPAASTPAVPAGDTAKHSDDIKKTEEGDLAHKEGTATVSNVFEQANKNSTGSTEIVRHELNESDLKSIYQSAKRSGSLNSALDEFALAHGIENVEALFPNPQLLNSTPDFNSRNMAWVQNVLDSTRKSPFARIRSIVADITQDEARAKGYIKGNFKKEEWFPLVSRTTTPTTIYKKQKLERDDVVDVVDFDVVAWLKGEMRIMLSEEIAVGILLGDGREVDDPDHISDPMGNSSGAGLRSIMNDDELYVTRVNVNVDDASSNYTEVVDGVLMASEFYKGTGSPTFYGTQRNINKMLLSKDGMLRRNYDNIDALAAAMGVSKIVAVEPMLRFPNVLGIVVNLTDYNIGTDRGGEVNLFDFFDIDFNQMKYLMETRISGAMVKLKSAIIISKTAAANVLVEPAKPTFVTSTGIVTVVATTGVVYKNADTAATLTAGAQTALAAGATLNIKAVPAAGFYFATTGTAGVDEWTFKRPSA